MVHYYVNEVSLLVELVLDLCDFDKGDFFLQQIIDFTVFNNSSLNRLCIILYINGLETLFIKYDRTKKLYNKSIDVSSLKARWRKRRTRTPKCGTNPITNTTVTVKKIKVDPFKLNVDFPMAKLSFFLISGNALVL